MRKITRAQLRILFGSVFLLSLGAAQFTLAFDAPAPFFLLPYRAWELLLGSLLALGAVPTLPGRTIGNLVAVIGVLAIAGSAVFLTKNSPFPGLAAVPVCAGTALLLWTGAGTTLVSRALSFPPLRFIGRISYSLYLWHWPITAFVWHVTGSVGPRQGLVVIPVSLVLSAISWAFVEQPFRRRPAAVPARRTLVYAALSTAAIALLTVTTAPVAREFWRVPARIEEVAAFGPPNAEGGTYLPSSCVLNRLADAFQLFDADLCLKRSDTKPNFLRLGDSHAEHFYAGLSEVAGINLMPAIASGCRPTDEAKGAPRCTQLVDYIVNDVLPIHPVDVFILSTRWTFSDIPALVRRIEKLKGAAKRIIVLAPVVEYNIRLPRLPAMNLYAHDATTPLRYRDQSRKELDRALKSVLAGTSAEYISTLGAICPDGECVLWRADGNPIQMDNSHLTPEGSKLIVPRMVGKLLGGDGSKSSAIQGCSPPYSADPGSAKDIERWRGPPPVDGCGPRD